MISLRSLCLLSLALLPSIAAQAETTNPLFAAWSAGKALVIAIDAAPLDADETYSDFAYYLNDFAASASDHWAFFRIDSQANSAQRPIQLDVAAPPYSVLFLKRGEPQGYLYYGPILEPQVYDFVRHRFEGLDVPDHLHPFSPDAVLVERVGGAHRRLRVDVAP